VNKRSRIASRQSTPLQAILSYVRATFTPPGVCWYQLKKRIA